MGWQELANEAAEHQLKVQEILGKAIEEGLAAGVTPDQVVQAFLGEVASGRTEVLDAPEHVRPVLTAIVMAEGLLDLAKGLIRIQAAE